MIAPLALALALALAAAPAGLCASPVTPDAVCSPTEDPALRERAAPLLDAIDRPASAEGWRRLPAGAREYLEAIAADPREYPSRRARALEGLAALGADAAIHERLASDPTTPFSVRHSAIRGVAALMAAEKAQRVLGGLMGADADHRIRATAAETLARAQPASACAAVKAQAARERSEVRPAFRRALAACGTR